MASNPPPPTASGRSGRSRIASLAFMGFAVGIVARDVLTELVLKEDGLSFAWLICVTVAVLASGSVVLTGQVRSLCRSLMSPRVAGAVAALGLLSSVIYGVTFRMIADPRMGAGLFDMIDYGLAPPLTVLVSIVLYNTWTELSGLDRRKLALSLVLYAVGIVLLTSRKPVFGFGLFAFAALSPIATALSDGISKWLLDDKNPARLTRSQLLTVRFVTPSVLLGAYASCDSPRGIVIADWPASLLVAAVFGFGPLWLLCTALGREGLIRLAAWEFLIPAGAFFITLPWHWLAFGHPGPIVGATFVLLAFVVHESGLLGRLAAVGTPPSTPGDATHIQ